MKGTQQLRQDDLAPTPRPMPHPGWIRRYHAALAITLRAWLAGLMAASLLPGTAVPGVAHGADKAGHAVLYAVLTLLLRLTSEHRPAMNAAMTASAIGGLLEIAQMLVPGRSADWVDMLSNSAGVIVGASVAQWILSPRQGHGAKTSC